jgi:hypothetical protein
MMRILEEQLHSHIAVDITADGDAVLARRYRAFSLGDRAVAMNLNTR